MRRQVAVHRSLDGVRVRLSGRHDLGRPVTSVARIAVADRLHEFSAGTRADALAWAADIGVRRLDQEFRIHGGRLRTGRTAIGDPATGMREPVLAAIWEGRRHAVFTHLYHARPADAVAFFDALRLTEHDDGITAVPRGRARRPGLAAPSGPAAAAVTDAVLVKEVPGLGLLEIAALDARTRRRLPPWRGAPVAGGELFRDTLPGQGPYFLLALRELLVTVLPEEHLAERIPGRLAGLAVEAVR
ncbi:hypothetical protein Acsp04_34920 [Actinomadura sp. NBRC 104425]|uniref:hypothetical protein n=1 Tax=Actinomadura sp. NBRC 104425 TaxID=3032204 RepID=UPI0024A60084|nr:hypothetical protein [Actinomadura sp. NBRC 104425]GLZ13257.1 hypothetical protein Acsp04_34920 [Actinomadura sp. NBRC 104425]